MNSNSLIAYFHKQKEILVKTLPKATKNQDVEAIHKLRVSIKTIKAIFLLIEFLSNDKFKVKNHFKILRTVFKTTGKIRDIQVQQQILADISVISNTSFSEYNDYLAKLERKSIKRFVKRCKAINDKRILAMDRDIHSAICNLNSDEIKDKALVFVANQFLVIQELRKQTMASDKWHKIRIELKKALYIIELINNFFEPGKKYQDLIGQIKELGEIIGNWHDRDIAHYQLKQFIKKSDRIPAENLASYKILLRSILEQ